MIMEHLKRAFAVGPREQLVEHDVGGKGGAVAVISGCTSTAADSLFRDRPSTIASAGHARATGAGR